MKSQRSNPIYSSDIEDEAGIVHEPSESGGAAYKRNIRKPQLKKIVPLAETTIYQMEERGEFPKRFFLTPRCVVWDLDEVEAWVAKRRQASDAGEIRRDHPDVRLRKTRPVMPY